MGFTSITNYPAIETDPPADHIGQGGLGFTSITNYPAIETVWEHAGVALSWAKPGLHQYNQLPSH